ncbi:hypothetical protein [Endozoicomonas numazuensis]|uniref:Uncharacterized protein n=1 Tax=Endozoicomonas numazuensis TaxID=1137799 RepID=A0A081NDK6_9GAMM|nr:hypothetical protein [Endozoicomonas numazuensis]KEQ16529.1 hypothetical protein GZ78_22030 [Endozoicomonas numazuensis]
MNIKDISISNNKKKQILSAISNHSVLFQEESGDIVVNTKAYQTYKEEKGQAPIEEITGLESLEDLADYIVFQ